MKRICNTLLICLISYSGANYAEPSVNPLNPDVSDAFNNEDLENYLKYLGGYLGYDINKSPDQIYSNFLSYTNDMSQYVQSIVNANFASALKENAIPSTIFTNSYSPTKNSNAGDKPLGMSKLIDQEPLQKDPVSQAVLNLLATPNGSCASYIKSITNKTQGTPSVQNFNELAANCEIRSQEQIPQNIVYEKITSPLDVYESNQSIVEQLNSNSLIGPLVFSTETDSQSTSSSQKKQEGLPAASQAQKASNFIRYATSAVSPAPQPFFNKINEMINAAPSKSKEARATLKNFVASLRSFAAQMSVGQSNLYYMLNKRLPQKKGNEDEKTSAALSEFLMASWRLQRPPEGQNQGTSWPEKINDASPATVQKEMALILAEINYQLYLTRQQQERILLTETMLLMQNAKMNFPDTSLRIKDENEDN